jgi:phosphotriesterase-related protein
MSINTANGRVQAGALGRTLMHEHLVTGLPGWDSDTRAPAPAFRDMVAACVDRVQELQDAGYSSLVDPCPSDLGRNADLIGEVAARTGFNIIFATGLYNEHHGGSPYWQVALATDPDGEKRLADLFIGEIEDGVRGSGLRPGILKVATGHGAITDYEKKVFRAAAAASKATGTPITTHTEAVLGDEQVDLLTGEGVAANRIVVGHCCGTTDHDYHMCIVRKGAYIGFDRFGIEHEATDDQRVESILKCREAGALEQVIVSHDSVWCWLGEMIPKPMRDYMAAYNHPLRFSRVIAPKLRAAGMSEAEIDTLLVGNPSRYFAA